MCPCLIRAGAADGGTLRCRPGWAADRAKVRDNTLIC